MPAETQQTQREWLENEIADVLLRHGPLTISDNSPRGLAKHLASAWPSSPQGLAVRQLVETVTALREHVKSLRSIPPLHVGESPPWHLVETARKLSAEVDTALKAARKAGLG